MKLKPGTFYKSKCNEIWCCYFVDIKAPSHAAAYCIRVSDSKVEYFYLDGRYDEAGKSQHCLIEIVEYGTND